MGNITKSFSQFQELIKEEDKYIDKVTYEMTGPPPKGHWSHKADFVEDMLKWGYTHTTLTKNTDMLIAADEDLGTLKCQKAEKFGIPIYSYEQAFQKKELLYKRVVRAKKIETLNKKSEKYLTVELDEEEKLQQAVKDSESKNGYFDFDDYSELRVYLNDIYNYLDTKVSGKIKDSKLRDIFDTSDFEPDDVKYLEKQLKKYQTNEYYKPILNQLERVIIMVTSMKE